MKVLKSSLIGLVALSAIVISSTGFAKKPSERFTVYDTAQYVEDMSGEFAILNLALSLNPAIEVVLDGNGQFTVFALSDFMHEVEFSLPAVDRFQEPPRIL